MCAIMKKRSRSTSECQQPPRKMQRILMSTLPDRMLQHKPDEATSPESHILETLKENDQHILIRSHHAVTDFFHPPTQAEIDAYDHNVIAAIRMQDLDTLHEYHSQGRPLKCSNKFGESLLHMACRKGMLEVTSFLVNQASVPFAVCDDYGRSPLHDACWAHRTNFELIDLILTHCPDLLYIQDKRGHTPLSYLRQDKWAAWNKYLQSKPPSFFLPRSTALQKGSKQ